jgi:hypothetical protein
MERKKMTEKKKAKTQKTKIIIPKINTKTSRNTKTNTRTNMNLKTNAKANTKTASRAKKQKKGDRFVCDDCGFLLFVEEPCGCADDCNLVCCDTQMTWVKN